MTPEEYKKLVEDQNLEWNMIMQQSTLLLQLAHQKNWSDLLALHEKRDACLRDFFEQTLAQEIVETVKNDLDTIKDQDLQIVQLVKNNQSELSAEAQHLQQMKERIKNYVSADQSKL